MKNMKKKVLLIVSIILMSIGFAAISTTLIINGSVNVSENQDDFSVIFTAASLDGLDVYSEVVDDTKKIITFETSELKTLNQTSVLNYEVTNNSSNYDANVQITCAPATDTTAEYTSIKNKLAGDVTVVKSKSTVAGTLTITLDKVATESVSEKYTCKLEFSAAERDESGKNVSSPVSFETDSWETIQNAVQTGNTSKYNVGDTKSVNLGSLGIHDVRIANKSTCTNEESETACGFVVEFTDIIGLHAMNLTDTNVGGWSTSQIRTYLNSTVLTSMPSDLQNVIVSTKVVSGHGSTSGEGNFVTQDKLYLLSAHELYNSDSNSMFASADTSYSVTRQLDYYKNLGITANDYDNAKKQYNGVDTAWWGRSSYSADKASFIYVEDTGRGLAINATSDCGISPMFRIA